jgi:hypothetical protein
MAKFTTVAMQPQHGANVNPLKWGPSTFIALLN